MARSDPNELSLAYMINCAQCSGFWIGLVAAVAVLPLMPQSVPESLYFVAVIAFGASFTSMFASRYYFR